MKKVRGRPPKSVKASEDSAIVDVKSRIKADPVPVKSNRLSGSMSLRPNKRVKISKYELITDELEDFDDEDDIITTPVEESDEDMAEDEPANDKLIVVQKTFGEKLELDEIAMEELSNKDAYEVEKLRRTRKKIMYHPKLAAQMRREQLMTPQVKDEDEDTKAKAKSQAINTTYEDNKDWICAACSSEMSERTLQKSHDIFSALTKRGKSLKDLMTSVVKVDLDESMISSKVCPSCYEALNQIENLYASFRSASDAFLDKFILGQKSLDADLAGVQQINDLAVLHGS